MTRVRSWAKWMAGTPLHPQWLMGRKLPPAGIEGARGRILDIGAADRWMERQIHPQAEYVALDYPFTGHDLYGARPDVFADAARLPFRSDDFDGVVCLEVLEHVPDPAQVVCEIARVLKPGGRAWISMPFLYPLHDAPFDFQRYTEYGLRRDMHLAGLEITSLAKSGHAIRTAGLLASLAIAGSAHDLRGSITAIAWVPAAVLLVVTINLAAFALSMVWPDWSHLAMGYEVEVRKP